MTIYIYSERKVESVLVRISPVLRIVLQKVLVTSRGGAFVQMEISFTFGTKQTFQIIFIAKILLAPLEAEDTLPIQLEVETGKIGTVFEEIDP